MGTNIGDAKHRPLHPAVMRYNKLPTCLFPNGNYFCHDLPLLSPPSGSNPLQCSDDWWIRYI